MTKETKQRKKTGTREWAETNKNICFGCRHNCRYCYSRANAKRFKWLDDVKNWEKIKLIPRRLIEKPRKIKGRIMFPSTHDIFPEFIDDIVKYLRGWLEVGNEILIVSKPHLECIQRICDDLGEFKDQIIFRFTIGSPNNEVLKFWEPNAPSYEERVESLKYAFEKGFTTSVSCEPYLDFDISLMVYELLPYINDCIWIGLMNRINQRVGKREELIAKGWTDKDFEYLDTVKKSQTDEFIEDLYDEFKDNKKVKWKDSIKKVMNLPEEEIG